MAHKNPRRVRMTDTIISWTRQANAVPSKFGQCKHLMKLFGGIMPFSVVVRVYPPVIIRQWLPHGIVPTPRLFLLMDAARYFGILLRPQDIYPEWITSDGPGEYSDALKWANEAKLTGKCKNQMTLEHHLAF